MLVHAAKSLEGKLQAKRLHAVSPVIHVAMLADIYVHEKRHKQCQDAEQPADEEHDGDTQNQSCTGYHTYLISTATSPKPLDYDACMSDQDASQSPACIL